MIKTIKDENNILLAKIVRASYDKSNTEFFTDENDELQFGVINYPKNHKTGTHCQNRSDNPVSQTDEILIVLEGSLRVDFYSNKGSYIKSSEIFKDDVLIIFQGAYNAVFLENTRVYSIKRGAYEHGNSKTRLIGANNLELVIDNSADEL